MSNSVFKKVHPTLFLSSGLLIAVLHVFAFFTQALEVNKPFPSLFAFYVEDAKVAIPLGFLGTLINAQLLMWVLNRHSIFKPKTFAPFLFFGLILGLYPPNLYFNSLFVAIGFFLWMLHKLLFLPSSQAKPKHIFDGAFFLGLASMFFWPAAFSMFIILIAAMINGMLNVRNLLLWILGFVLPWFLVRGIYFLFEWPFTFPEQWKVPDISIFFNQDLSLIILIFSLITLVVGLFFFYKSLEKTTVESRNQKRVVGLAFFVWVLSAWSVFLTPVKGSLFFLMLSPILAYLYSVIMHQSTWKPIRIVFLLGLAAILVYNYSQLVIF
ncbi:MAG: DUF6427 family protein [Luteibaculum sp.]